jgi:hypothetical protein
MRRALFALAALKRMEGKVEDERSSLPLTAAIRLHCAAVHFDEILYDGQPESQPAMLPPCRSKAPAEAGRSITFSSLTPFVSAVGFTPSIAALIISGSLTR